MEGERRQLIATLFADITGYTALMQNDEQNALKSLARFKQCLEEQVSNYEGEIQQYYGDGCLAVFSSSLNAVNCARNLQQDFSTDPQVPVRIGIHLGEAVFRDNNVFGDSVNIASRIESMGVPGSVLVSKTIRDQIRNQSDLPLVPLGSFDFKNVEQPVEVFALNTPGLAVPKREDLKGKFKESVSKRSTISYAIGALVLVALVITGIKFLTPGSSTIDDGVTTLGIFPFSVEGSDAELDYLAEGIPENLINKISQLDGLDVLSKNSTFILQDSLARLERLKDLLNADVVLTGSIRPIQGFMVLNCQLTQLSTGKQLWGHKFRHPDSDIFALEEEVANELVKTLELELTPDSDEYVPSPEAYTHFLKGRLLTYGSTAQESEKALEHFRQAVQIDANYAEAYAQIAKVKFVQAMFGNTSREQMILEAKTATETALKLDPGLLEAHLAQANLKIYVEQDWQGAYDAFKAAARSDPRNVDLNIEYAYFLNLMGDYEAARGLADKALELDPISRASLHMAAWTRFFTGGQKESIEMFEKALELSPSWTWGWLKLGIAHYLDGNCKETVRCIDKANDLADEWGSDVIQTYIGICYLNCGEDAKAQAAYDRMIDYLDTDGDKTGFAYAALYAMFDDRDEFLKWSRMIVDNREISCYAMKSMPELGIFETDAFDDPAYQELVESLNFLEL